MEVLTSVTRADGRFAARQKVAGFNRKDAEKVCFVLGPLSLISYRKGGCTPTRQFRQLGGSELHRSIFQQKRRHPQWIASNSGIISGLGEAPKGRLPPIGPFHFD